MTLLLLLALSQTPSGVDIEIEDLTGLWQAGTCIGSGLADVWLFLPEGTCLFRTSSMDGASRIREFGGTWEILGDTLRVSVSWEITAEGGRMVPNDGSTSIGGDSVLVDFEEVENFPEPPLLREYVIESLELETMDQNPDLPADLMRLDMDGITYWRFTADPESAIELLGD